MAVLVSASSYKVDPVSRNTTTTTTTTAFGTVPVISHNSNPNNNNNNSHPIISTTTTTTTAPATASAYDAGDSYDISSVFMQFFEPKINRKRREIPLDVHLGDVLFSMEEENSFSPTDLENSLDDETSSTTSSLSLDDDSVCNGTNFEVSPKPFGINYPIWKREWESSMPETMSLPMYAVSSTSNSGTASSLASSSMSMKQGNTPDMCLARYLQAAAVAAAAVSNGNNPSMDTGNCNANESSSTFTAAERRTSLEFAGMIGNFNNFAAAAAAAAVAAAAASSGDPMKAKKMSAKRLQGLFGGVDKNGVTILKKRPGRKPKHIKALEAAVAAAAAAATNAEDPNLLLFLSSSAAAASSSSSSAKNKRNLENAPQGENGERKKRKYTRRVKIPEEEVAVAVKDVEEREEVSKFDAELNAPEDNSTLNAELDVRELELDEEMVEEGNVDDLEMENDDDDDELMMEEEEDEDVVYAPESESATPDVSLLFSSEKDTRGSTSIRPCSTNGNRGASLSTSYSYSSHYRCSATNCNRTFKHKSTLHHHMKRHMLRTPVYNCPEPNCTKIFIDRKALSDHKRTHSTLRPFSCEAENCHATFKKRAHLLEHIRVHSGEKPFRCTWPNCNKLYRHKSSLTSHIKLQHNPNYTHPISTFSSDGSTDEE